MLKLTKKSVGHCTPAHKLAWTTTYELWAALSIMFVKGWIGYDTYEEDTQIRNQLEWKQILMTAEWYSEQFFHRTILLKLLFLVFKFCFLKFRNKNFVSW